MQVQIRHNNEKTLIGILLYNILNTEKAMKLRMIITALCLCMGVCAMAQGHGNRGNRAGRGAQSGPQNLDMVVDTAIINSMDLEPELIAAVLQLQAQKQEELKVVIIKMAQSRQEGQGFDQDAIAAMRQQMDDFKQEYRMALRKVLGAANYITYLEKQLDKRPAMGGGMPGGNRRMMQGGQGGFGGGNRGGFGGGNWGQDDDNNMGGGFGDNK